jgi:hypothetical protein
MPSTPDDEDDEAAVRLENRETVRLPIQRRPEGSQPPQPRTRKAPLALAATVTTFWAAVVSLAPVLLVVGLVYALDSAGGTAGRVLRFGTAAWLLAHGVPVHVGFGTIGLAPLGISLIAAWRVARAGVHTARAVGARRGRTPWPAAAAGGAVGLVYGIFGLLAALLTSQDGVEVPAIRAGLTLAVFGVVLGGAGAMAEARVLHRWVVSAPPVLRDGVRAGVVAALLIIGGGAGLAGMAVALNGGDASQIFSDYNTGVAGQLGLTLVCAMYGPNLIVWAASYTIGPGFAIGTGTIISAGEVRLGPMPALPVLAGLPSEPATGWASLILGLPVAAALVAGWLLARRALRGRDRPGRGGAKPPAVPMTWGGLLGAAMLAGPVAGVLLAVASMLSSGSLGDGRLAQVGPYTVWVAALAALVVAVGAALAAASTKLVLGARRSGA